MTTERDTWRWAKPEDGGADDWAIPIEEIQRLQAKYQSRIRPLTYAEDGTPTISSLCWRAADAVKAARDNGEQVLTFGGLRKTQKPPTGWEKNEARRWNQEALERFIAGTQQALEKIGLGRRAIEQLGDLQPWLAISHVDAWLASNAWCLVLGGLPGSGKTQALAHALSKLGVDVIRTTSGHEERQWRPGWAAYRLASEIVGGQAFGPEADERIGKLLTVRVLAIDDLGTEPQTPVGSDVLYRVIDARYRSKKKTLIATNLHREEVHKRYAGRIMRRLSEDALWRSCNAPTLLSKG